MTPEEEVEYVAFLFVLGMCVLVILLLSKVGRLLWEV